MRKVITVLAVVVFGVSAMFAGTRTFVTGVSGLTTANIQAELSMIGAGDTLYILLTEPMTTPAFVCMYITGGKSVIRHPSSCLILLNREILEGYPINTITAVGSGSTVSGFEVWNTSGAGSGICGTDNFKVKNCQFHQAPTGLTVYAGGDFVSIDSCRFVDTDISVDVEAVGVIGFHGNVVDIGAGRVTLNSTSLDLGVRGNKFISGTRSPLWLSGTIIDVENNLVVGPGSSSSDDGIRFVRAVGVVCEHNTVIGYHNAATFDDTTSYAYIDDNIFVGGQTSLCCLRGVMHPTSLRNNHLNPILYGDTYWNIDSSLAVNTTTGDPQLNGDCVPISTSPCHLTASDGTDKGWSGGEASLSITEPPSIPDPASATRHSVVAGPNPFNSALSLNFEAGAKRVEIYDLRGRKISSSEVEGQTSFLWNPQWEPSGTYLVRINYNNEVVTRRVQLIR